ncbi:MAG: hypothetical protein GY786_03865 [Proteobacteria bacterium]|nr:hypothetical protein [Pseudomonadota bacterium]
MSDEYYWGVDCGSSAIKVALLDGQKNVVHLAKNKSLFPLLDHVKNVMEEPGFPVSPFEEMSEMNTPIIREGHSIVTTGYGRNHVPFSQKKLTEIKGHFLGVSHQVQEKGDYTVIDIGGQDSKIITVKDNNIRKFNINRKCAAGTGAFIEELAHRLEIELPDLPDLAKKFTNKISLNSFCTVFAVSEVIKILVSGERVENLVKALYESVVKRVLEIAPIETNHIVFSGGVLRFHHEILVESFKNRLPGKTFELAPNAQYCGAIGAACFGIENNAA